MAESVDVLFRAGKLTDAVGAATARVKSAPGDPSARLCLAELLAMSGDFERADKHLDFIMQQNPDFALPTSLFRQLLRGESLRQRLFSDGPLPQFYNQVGMDEMKTRLEAIVCLRTNQAAEAKALVDRADTERKPTPASYNGKPIADVRDLDDCYGGVLEVLTANGTYYWLSIASIQAIEFRPPTRSRDLCWRSASLELTDGVQAEVYVPAVYVPPPEGADEATRMGRSTDWKTLPGGVVRGVGQRMMLLGDDAVPILEIAGRLEFAQQDS